MRQSYRIFPLITMVLLLISGIPLLADSNVGGEITTTRGITITVDQSGVGDYTTIQNAVDNSTDGDKIIINSGTYYEEVIIDKELEIEGSGNNQTIINGTGTKDAIIIIDNNTIISNIKIDNCTNGIIIINNYHNLSIFQCTFNAISTMSILCNYNCSDIIIYDNFFLNNVFGISTDSNHFKNSSRIIIKNNTFINTELRAIGTSSEETLIINNYILNVRDAISLWGGNATIIDNSINGGIHLAPY